MDGRVFGETESKGQFFYSMKTTVARLDVEAGGSCAEFQKMIEGQASLFCGFPIG